MREHVDAGETLRGAARIIATRHGPELPQGSAHHRSFESTVDLLRREYAAWEIEEEEAEAVRQAVVDGIAQLNESVHAALAPFRTPEMLKAAAHFSTLDFGQQFRRRLEAKYGDLSGLQLSLPNSDHLLAKLIKSQIRSK
jgi:hypothetical protein